MTKQDELDIIAMQKDVHYLRKHVEGCVTLERFKPVERKVNWFMYFLIGGFVGSAFLFFRHLAMPYLPIP